MWSVPQPINEEKAASDSQIKIDNSLLYLQIFKRKYWKCNKNV